MTTVPPRGLEIVGSRASDRGANRRGLVRATARTAPREVPAGAELLLLLVLIAGLIGAVFQ